MLLYDGFHKIEQIEVNGVVREKLLIKSAVAALVVDKHDKIALVKQLRPTVGHETWEIPAGVMDKELSPLQTMIEELQEECDLDMTAVLSVKEEMNYYLIPGSSDATMTLYSVIYDAVGENKLIDDADVTEVGWFTREAAYGLVKNGAIRDPKTIVAIWALLHQID